jgi:enterobactin synthetase component D
VSASASRTRPGPHSLHVGFARSGRWSNLEPVSFRLDLEHGRCVGIPVPADVDDDTLAAMHPEERALARSIPGGRRATWVAGRQALRAALEDLGLGGAPLLATDRGAPLVPAGALGSISHKRTLAVAVAAPRTPGLQLGVDLEEDAPLRVDVSRRVLTPRELEDFQALAPPARDRAVLLRLSAKEAIYKALDPFVRRYVSFQEAEVFPDDKGGGRVVLSVPEGSFAAELRWRALPGFLLTTVTLRRC